jgi:gas vesicle protein
MSARNLSFNNAASPAWLKQLLFPSAIGAVTGIVVEFFRLLDSQPKDSIELLKSWGPSFLLGILVIAVIGKLLTQMLDISRDGVAAQTQMAEAIGRIAEKDDRQFDEMRRMSQYSAQMSERVVELISDQSAAIRNLSNQMKEHGRILERFPMDSTAKGQGA